MVICTVSQVGHSLACILHAIRAAHVASFWCTRVAYSQLCTFILLRKQENNNVLHLLALLFAFCLFAVRSLFGTISRGRAWIKAVHLSFVG